MQMGRSCCMPKEAVTTAFWDTCTAMGKHSDLNSNTNHTRVLHRELRESIWFTNRTKILANLVRTIHADTQRGNHWQFCESDASSRVHVRNSSFLIGFRSDNYREASGSTEVPRWTFWKRRKWTSDGILRSPMGAGGCYQVLRVANRVLQGTPEGRGSTLQLRG